MRNRLIVSSVFVLIVVLGLSLPGLCEYDLWRVNQEGGDIKQITHFNSEEGIPWAESPTGELLAVGTYGEIQIIDWDGTVLNIIPGEKVVNYIPLAWNEQGIYVCTYEKERVTKLTLISPEDFQQIAEWKLNIEETPIISLDGKNLVFAKKTFFSYTGYLLDLTSKKMKKIGQCSKTLLTQWAPDSKYFTFNDSKQKKFIMDLDGKPVHSFDNIVTTLGWSPNGKYFLYHSFSEDGIVVYDLEERKSVAKIESLITFQADWSKDNEHFIYTDVDLTGKGSQKILLGNIDGEIIGDIIEPVILYKPAWAFNEAYIVFNKRTEKQFSFVDSTGEYDFRKTVWGMSKKEVMKTETIKLQAKHADSLVYETVVAGFPVFVMYIFEKDRLHSAFYAFPQFIEKSSFENYDVLKSMLMTECGEPLFSKFYKGVEEYAGDVDISMIRTEGVRLMTYWQAQNVYLILQDTNGTLNIVLGSRDLKY